MSTKAVERRIEALNTLNRRVVTTEYDPKIDKLVTTWHMSDREAIAYQIRELQTLGRTDRWRNALANWANMVETEDAFEWAFFQGGIWAAHAVE